MVKNAKEYATVTTKPAMLLQDVQPKPQVFSFSFAPLIIKIFNFTISRISNYSIGAVTKDIYEIYESYDERKFISFNLDDEEYFSETMVSTHSVENTTLYTQTISTTKPTGTVKNILILLIQLFGGVDILLICSYTVVFMIDRRRNKNQKENSNGQTARYTAMYENIEIDY